MGQTLAALKRVAFAVVLVMWPAVADAQVNFGGHTYYYLPPDTWPDQEAAAIALGGHLASINSLAENAFILDFGSDGLVDGIGGADVWIGLTDIAAEFGNTSTFPYPAPGNTPSDEAGTQRGEGWAWTDGSSLLFQNWNSGEPNDFGLSTEEDYAYILPNGFWNDRESIFVFRGVAEVVPEPSTLALAAFGLIGLGTWQRRGRQAKRMGQIPTTHEWDRPIIIRGWPDIRRGGSGQKTDNLCYLVICAPTGHPAIPSEQKLIEKSCLAARSNCRFCP